MEVSAYGLSETLVQVIEHNPNLRRIELNLYEHYSQKFSYKEMMVFQDRLNRLFKSISNVKDLMMRIQMEFQDETKAFTYDLSKLTSINKIWIQHRGKCHHHESSPSPLNTIWVQQGNSSTGQILDQQGFPATLTQLSLYSITTPISPLLRNVPKENITNLGLQDCTYINDFFDPEISPAMLYTIDNSGKIIMGLQMYPTQTVIDSSKPESTML